MTNTPSKICSVFFYLLLKKGRLIFMQTNTEEQKLLEIAARIKEMREIMGWSIAEMAVKTEVSEQQYIDYENAIIDFPFTFIHK